MISAASLLQRLSGSNRLATINLPLPMKKTPGLIFIFLLVVSGLKSMAQDSLARYQVAVFSPLFLDSAFDETTTYRYGKTFPKFINPGLEFYEGAELAIDSLNS